MCGRQRRDRDGSDGQDTTVGVQGRSIMASDLKPPSLMSFLQIVPLYSSGHPIFQALLKRSFRSETFVGPSVKRKT